MYRLYVRLVKLSHLFFCTKYLLQCLVDHMLSKTRKSSGHLQRVMGEVLVLVLLLVVYKIPYSSCM